MIPNRFGNHEHGASDHDPRDRQSVAPPVAERPPRRVLDLESLARLHRDFTAKRGGGRRADHARRQRQGRRE